jgi:hypothetical protein
VSMKETFRICDQSVYNAEYTYLETVICGKWHYGVEYE